VIFIDFDCLKGREGMEDNKKEIPRFEDDIFNIAREDKAKAFDLLYKRYAKRIVNFAYYIVKNRQHAQEIVHDAFLKAWDGFDKFEGGSKLSTWLYTIARNLSYNYLKHKKYEPDVSLDEKVLTSEGEVDLINALEDQSMLSPDKAALNKEAQAIVRKAIASLDPKYREVITLCDIQGLSYQEAASIVGCATNLIGMRLLRARNMIADMLKIE